MRHIHVITARRFYIGALLLAVFGFSPVAFADIKRTVELPLASVYAAIAPLGSDEPIYSQHADQIVPIASLTKLMTALVILESGLPLDEGLEVSRISNTFGKNAHSRLRPGTQVSRRDLLQMSLMSSENMATYTLAANYPGGVAAFVSAMNATAVLLGMRNTRFTDPTGLSPDNQSTARDLLILSAAVYQYPLIRQLSTQGKIDMHFRSPRYSLAYTNTNPLTRNAEWKVMLSKTGYLSESGRCLIMVADIDGELVTMVLLDSQGLRTPIGDVGRINRWLRNQSPGEVPASALAYAQSRLATMQ
ncbi:serine hydrolase [Nitrincola iocasae]|jgi:D-alanyl-D-alanine endopeptidase (penicillin-binding protein 7)|uniref:D-alanyl-D-alanine endopeptidase n=1 Tax=Nitrincola iocasae TaxID=2614693 RepID=A0A5J6LDU6_9GAMM|nr:serine hydrolase [Nitrincola iocasae]QEW06730.1 D-alanyl-D-alanine endopeptidase [Nitrincola iocasae]